MRINLSTLVVTGALAVASVAVLAQPPAGGPPPGMGPGGPGGPGGGSGGRGGGRGRGVGGPGSPTADGSRAVTDGGIKVAGWTGQIDAGEAKAGMTIKDAELKQEGANIHITTGPATTYWRTADKASGDFTVKASFLEPKYQNLNSHPHPYGVFIGGNDMGGDNMTAFYCAAYGNGNFIVRGFAPAPFQMNGRGAASPAVHKADGIGQPVSQDVAIQVKGSKVDCIINGTSVASYDKSEIIGDGKIKSTDGAFGLRFSHNTEVIVSGFGMSK